MRTTNSQQGGWSRLLRNRRTIILSLVAAVGLVLLAYNLTSWFFLQKIGKSLDDELGRRLQAVAEMTAASAEMEVFGARLGGPLSEVEQFLLRTRFDEVRRNNQLQAIFLVDRDMRTLAASPEHFLPGERISYLVEDSLVIAQALRGQPAASAMHVIESRRFKSGYAPVKNAAGRVFAVVAVEASATFFSLLTFFQRSLIIGGVASLALMAVFTLFSLWAVTLFVRLQDSVQKNERLAAMGQMAATVAHEIRNPLGIIKSTAEVLQRRYRGTGAEDELFAFIPSEVDRLNRLVNDFLAFARNRDLTLERGDLLQTVRKAVADVQQEYREHPVQIEFRADLDSLPAAHDPDGLRQVVINLLHNSVEALDGTGTVRVEVGTHTSWGKRFVRVEVRDDGPGFSDAPDKIFEPFYTTKTSGSGLGLAVSKQIIEKHQGRIEATALPEGGAAVRFYLPLR